MEYLIIQIKNIKNVKKTTDNNCLPNIYIFSVD